VITAIFSNEVCSNFTVMSSQTLLSDPVLVQNQCCSVANCGKMVKSTKPQTYTEQHKSLYIVKTEAETGDSTGDTE
jgi:hypothetical protein